MQLSECSQLCSVHTWANQRSADEPRARDLRRSRVPAVTAPGRAHRRWCTPQGVATPDTGAALRAPSDPGPRQGSSLVSLNAAGLPARRLCRRGLPPFRPDPLPVPSVCRTGGPLGRARGVLWFCVRPGGPSASWLLRTGARSGSPVRFRQSPAEASVPSGRRQGQAVALGGALRWTWGLSGGGPSAPCEARSAFSPVPTRCLPGSGAA